MGGLEQAGKHLILLGVFIIAIGLLLTLWSRIPLLGKLPGDIFIQKGNFQFYLPVVTGLVVSILLTILANLIIRLLGE